MQLTMLHLRLDLTPQVVEGLAAEADALTASGLPVTTLADEIRRSQEAMACAYDLHHACRDRQPPMHLRAERIPLERWRKVFAEEGRAAHYHIVASKIDWIGVAFIEMKPEGVAECGFTGVLYRHAGKGIARGVKAAALCAAARAGAIVAVTDVLEVNMSMLRVNQRLGFMITGSSLREYPDP